MSHNIVFLTDNGSLHPITSFPNQPYQCLVIERNAPDEAEGFFSQLMNQAINVQGKVDRDHAFSDLNTLLEKIVPDNLKKDSFYSYWLYDMAKICESFCQMLKSESLKFTLSSQRGCRRFHVDYVKFRLLVTYAGEGTEWISDKGANRKAFLDGAPNEEIILDSSEVNHMKKWDIALFRGGPKGLLHRTPDLALNNKSVLMRLDII